MKTALFTGLMLAFCAGMRVKASQTEPVQLDIRGSMTMSPVAQTLAQTYREQYPDVHITVRGIGSAKGAQSLIEGQCQIALMNRPMNEEELASALKHHIFPDAHAIAFDAVAIVVHPSNPVQDVTSDQLRKIISGQIINWKALGGHDKDIVLIPQSSGSGSVELLSRYLFP